MLKTFETKRNNMAKRMYLPPYATIDLKRDEEKISKLNTQIYLLKWVLGIKEPKEVTFPTSTWEKVKIIGVVVASMFKKKEPIYIKLFQENESDN